ncbi:transposase [Tissierella praeacuta]|uniref:RNA-guided endonuclease InsQ/TnpB family protein n=1 Tax=Tissierella praeacuta TaxID=43131 RepID=UPI0033407CC0
MTDIHDKKPLYGMQKQQLKHLKAKEYKALRELCFLSKNIYNVALYNIRQHYFSNKTFLSYNDNYHLLKTNENYKLMNNNSAQQIIKVVDRSFKSFFSLIEKAKNGEYSFKDIKLPKYLKKDGYFNLIFAEFNISKGFFQLPMSIKFRKLYGKIIIKVPRNLKGKIVKEIRIIPKNNARFFEIQYIYEYAEPKEDLNKENALSIDLGVDNLATCTTNTGNAFIIDGKKLKSINRWANKENSRLQGIKDKQKIKGNTKKQERLWNKRNNRVNDYLNKSAKYIIDYCKDNNIGTIIIGYNKDIQRNSNLGKANNQNFVNIPLGNLKDKITYLSKRIEINLIEQEESYTSRASFLDEDYIPNYKEGKTYKFSGYRISRGKYQSADSIILNADINGSLNIMRKANIVNINLINKEYLNPKRIKIS